MHNLSQHIQTSYPIAQGHFLSLTKTLNKVRIQQPKTKNIVILVIMSLKRRSLTYQEI